MPPTTPQWFWNVLAQNQACTFGESFSKAFKMLLTDARFSTESRTIDHTIPPTKMLEKRKTTGLKSAAPSPLDSTFAFQQGLGGGRRTVSPEIRKCHCLEVSHRSGSSGFGHIQVGVVEGDMLGMCLQKFVHYFNRSSTSRGIGKGGIRLWAWDRVHVPSILFEKSLSVEGFISRRIHPRTIGLCALGWVHSMSSSGGEMPTGPPPLHCAQQGSLDCVFSFSSPGALVPSQAMPLWGGIGRNVAVIGMLHLVGVQIASRIALQFLQV